MPKSNKMTTGTVGYMSNSDFANLDANLDYLSSALDLQKRAQKFKKIRVEGPNLEEIKEMVMEDMERIIESPLTRKQSPPIIERSSPAFGPARRLYENLTHVLDGTESQKPGMGRGDIRGNVMRLVKAVCPDHPALESLAKAEGTSSDKDDKRILNNNPRRRERIADLVTRFNCEDNLDDEYEDLLMSSSDEYENLCVSPDGEAGEDNKEQQDLEQEQADKS